MTTEQVFVHDSPWAIAAKRRAPRPNRLRDVGLAEIEACNREALARIDIDESRLRARTYLHEGLDLDAAVSLWSNLTHRKVMGLARALLSSPVPFRGGEIGITLDC